MVAAPRAVAVELAAADLVLEQVPSRRAVGLDRARRRNVVGGDRIAEDRQRPRPIDVGQRLGRHRHSGEIGRVLDVGRSGRPAVGLAALDLDRPPALVAAIDVGIAAAEHCGMDVRVDQHADLLVGRPDVPEEHRLAVRRGADRLIHHVGAHRAFQRIGHHQRWRGEIVRPAVGRHAAFEVAVAGEHADGDQVVVVDRLADRLGQRP